MKQSDAKRHEESAGNEILQDVISKPSSGTSKTVLFGLLVVAFIFFGGGVWAALAPLAEAIPAAAVLSVKGERKKVQHFEGGIVVSLHVSEGEMVEEGQLLLRLDPLQANATLSRLKVQRNVLLTREARLESELRGDNAITFSGFLLQGAASSSEILDIIESEQKHFKARRETYRGQVNILKQRIEQLQNEIDGHKIQRQARLDQYEIFKEESLGLKGLYQKGYYPKSKILAMERAIIDLRGAAGNDAARIARSKNAQGEAENQIIAVEQRFREDVVGSLKDTKSELSDLKERIIVADDVLVRGEIRAPRSGIIQALQVHTIGGVVMPGVVLMEIAPQDDDLVVSAKISPEYIDSVAIGQKAEVRLTALNVRTTPIIYGYVTSISGDALTNPNTGERFFRGRIEISKDERLKLKDEKLSAGMPAEVLIKTGNRTMLTYLAKPLTDALARGLNED
jgi:HlyD family secretion protein/epimerase transport system membrane fusion protein